jgi:hypothetical protein
MTAKTLAKFRRSSSKNIAFGRQLRQLLEEQRGLTEKLVALLEELEDRQDHLRIVAAKKQNGDRPAVSWKAAKKRLLTSA